MNAERELYIIRRRAPPPKVLVYAAFPRRKKDVHHTGVAKRLTLVRSAALVKITEDDVIAYRIEEKLIRAGRTEE